MSDKTLFQPRPLFLYIIVITVITVKSTFHLTEVKMYHVSILVNQNDIIQHVTKVTISVA